MPPHSDLTFITNEQGKSLLERFKVLIQDTVSFDVLVGYFYTSGFHALYTSLEKTQRIRILIGIGVDTATVRAVEQSRRRELPFSHAETKAHFSGLLAGEMENAEDSRRVEEGVYKFMEWLQSGKLEIKAYPAQNLHAKLYIMAFGEGDRDAGRVITGSSNFTQSGLADNLEFNVELKARADYEFAKKTFEALWKDAVDVKEKYLETIRERTWLNDAITPYQLYLKFLYEYFKDELRQTDEAAFEYFPAEFLRLGYQEQAVLNAKKILEEYGGVFISDVVGLGKTYISAMLASRLDGRTLVLAPPVLLDNDNPGSWPCVFSDFRVPADFESLGKLDRLAERGTGNYKNVFIDEAHRFRTEATRTYEKLAQICRGKRVILVTATPLNNTPSDILSQIKLFQNARKSAIPNVPDLETFFSSLEKKITKLDRQKDRAEYMHTAGDNAGKIRESVLKYLMVRRTRKEIESYFANDLNNQNLKFPEVEVPQSAFYQLNEEENEIFDETVRRITQEFKYARYMPMLYYTGKTKPDQLERQSQRNMGSFMKILLIKRLESSFHAFRNTVDRFIRNHELFLEELQKGNVYVSKKYAGKIFELMNNDDDEGIQVFLDGRKAKRYPACDFSEDLQGDLQHDLNILEQIRQRWSGVKRDPKLLCFAGLLANHQVLKENKLIVFTESKETADHLAENLENQYSCKVLVFTGASGAAVRRRVIANFDARARSPRNDYRILVATEVLSEGVNLHASCVVINYDIPWNPTRLMQRVGRINRVDTKFDRIYSFNFFPTKQSNDQIKLKEAAEAKIQSFISLLGTDARLLTEGEDIESHRLFDRLVSKSTITGEDQEVESELKYLQVIREIRDNDPNLFEQVKRLPKKARTARKHADGDNQLLTYFRQGKLQKFFLADAGDSKEIDFMNAAGRLEAEPKSPREKLPADFYDRLTRNKKAFTDATTEADAEIDTPRGGRDAATRVLTTLKAVRDLRKYTDEQETCLSLVMTRVEEGALPRQTIRTIWQALNKACTTDTPDPLKLIAILQHTIPEALLKRHVAETAAETAGPKEVILSEYLIAD